jgi:hypothetical protein
MAELERSVEWFLGLGPDPMSRVAELRPWYREQVERAPIEMANEAGCADGAVWWEQLVAAGRASWLEAQVALRKGEAVDEKLVEFAARLHRGVLKDRVDRARRAAVERTRTAAVEEGERRQLGKWVVGLMQSVARASWVIEPSEVPVHLATERRRRRGAGRPLGEISPF